MRKQNLKIQMLAGNNLKSCPDTRYKKTVTLNMQCRKTFLHFFDITECQHFGFYLLNETGKLLLIFSKFNNEHTANIDCSWASFLDILDDFSKFCSAFSTLLKIHQICLEFGKK